VRFVNECRGTDVSGKYDGLSYDESERQLNFVK